MMTANQNEQVYQVIRLTQPYLAGVSWTQFFFPRTALTPFHVPELKSSGMSVVIILACLETIFLAGQFTLKVIAKLSPSSSFAKPSWGLGLVLILINPGPTHPPTHPD